MNEQIISVGSKVRFRLAGNSVVGRVLEDRGPIGRGGRRLYHVRYEMGKGNWYSTELPASVMEDVEFKPVNRRRMREVASIIPVESVEGYSVFAAPKHAQSLTEFLRGRLGRNR